MEGAVIAVVLAQFAILWRRLGRLEGLMSESMRRLDRLNNKS